MDYVGKWLPGQNRMAQVRPPERETSHIPSWVGLSNRFTLCEGPTAKRLGWLTISTAAINS